MDFKGKITYIGKEQKVWQNDLPKLTFVVEEVEGEYPSSLAIDLLKEKIELIQNYKVGDVVTVSLNFRAREWKDKRFTNISAWRIQGEWSWSTTSSSKETKKEEKKEDDDLPF